MASHQVLALSTAIGFETLNPANLTAQRKYQNLNRDYSAAIRRLHDLGVMINGSFVFGMDEAGRKRQKYFVSANAPFCLCCRVEKV